MDEATKAKIAKLRRERASAKGKAERADDTATFLRRKAVGENSRYHDLGRQIVALGGKIRS